MKGFLFLLVAVSLMASPAIARDPEMIGLGRSVLASSSTRMGQVSQRAMYDSPNFCEVPAFWLKCPSRIFVKIIANGGISSEEARSIEHEARSRVAALARTRNLRVSEGTPSGGDYLLEILVSKTSGRDMNRNYGSNSRSDTWRRHSESSSSSGSDSQEMTGMFVVFKPALYQIGLRNRDIVAEPEGRFAISDAQITSSREDHSASRSESYSWRGYSSSTSRSERDGSEWQNDPNMAKGQMFEGLIQKSKEAVDWTFKDWSDVILAERYAEIKTREANQSPARSSGFSYTIEQQ